MRSYVYDFYFLTYPSRPPLVLAPASNYCMTTFSYGGKRAREALSIDGIWAISCLTVFSMIGVYLSFLFACFPSRGDNYCFSHIRRDGCFVLPP